METTSYKRYLPLAAGALGDESRLLLLGVLAAVAVATLVRLLHESEAERRVALLAAPPGTDPTARMPMVRRDQLERVFAASLPARG